MRERIGRYQVEGLLGSGGMGVVLVARDPELGRQVALKLVRAAGGDTARDGHRGRLVREAKAMAALSHPNVVTIYDVGEEEGEVYLALELVRGRTLREWLREAPRSWREILPIFVQAGRGLVAAHEIDIIHRDFKPENVFVGDDGRVRVGDFGLARAPGPTPAVPADAELSTDETRTGAVLGTLRYMAPEQVEGQRADERTDQFSFCVSLHEALYGVRPFVEATLEGLRAAFRAKREAVMPRTRKVPAWLARTVARGLRIDPAARFPSMAALLRALTDDLAARRRRLALGAATGGLIASVAVAYVVGQAVPRDEPRTCRGGPEMVARVFGPEARAGVAAVFAASPQPFVRSLGERVIGRLGQITDEWLAAHVETCEATVVRGEQPPEVMGLRMACLSDRLRDLGGLVRQLEVAPQKELVRSLEAVQSLAPISLCGDVERLRARVPPPPDARTLAAAEAVRARILEARLTNEMGAYARAVPIAEAAVADAARAGYPPVEGEARFQLGQVLDYAGRGAEGTAELHKAAAIADGSRDDELAAQARTELVYSLGYREGKLAEAEQMVPYAEAAIKRLGGSPQLTVKLLFHRSASLAMAQKPAEALPLTHEALAILERTGNPDKMLLSSLYNRLGTDYKELGRYLESLAAYDKGVALREQLLGPDHPSVAVILGNRGGTLRYLARYDDAVADLERALKIREEVLGPEHPEVAASLTNLANVHAVLKKDALAHRERERALAIVTKALPPDHPHAVTMRCNFVDSLLSVGKNADATAFCDRWLPVEREKRPDKRLTGNLLMSCAMAELRAGRERQAWELYREGDAIISSPRPDEPGVEALAAFARELVAHGKGVEAVPILERVIEIRREVLGPEHPRTVESATLLETAQRRPRR